MPEAQIDEIREYVKELFSKADIEFCGIEWFFKYHISVVHSIAVELAKRYGADETVVELAALLHDIGLTIDQKRHDEVGAEEAKKVLMNHGYQKDLAERVADCIRSHMCRSKQPETVEAKILCTADALCKFKTSFFFVKFGVRKSKPDEVVEWMKRKIEREWNKIFFVDEKEDARKEYEALKAMLNYGC